MSLSLRDQLLKAGLVNEKQAKQAGKQKQKQQRLEKKGQIEVDDSQQQAALQAKADSFKAMYEAAKPKADAFTLIEEATGSLTVTEAAKALNAKRVDLYGYLEHRKWVTKGKHRQAAAAAQRSGYMDVRTHTDPRGRVHTSPVVTPKGFAYLAQREAKKIAA